MSLRLAVLRSLRLGKPLSEEAVIRRAKEETKLNPIQAWLLPRRVPKILKQLCDEGRVQATPSKRDPNKKLYSIVYGLPTLSVKKKNPFY